MSKMSYCFLIALGKNSLRKKYQMFEKALCDRASARFPVSSPLIFPGPHPHGLPSARRSVELSTNLLFSPPVSLLFSPPLDVSHTHTTCHTHPHSLHACGHTTRHTHTLLTPRLPSPVLRNSGSLPSFRPLRDL